MDYIKLIDQRHSVRAYTDRKVEPAKLALIEEEVARASEESGLRIQYINDASGVYDLMSFKLIGWRGTPAGVLAFVGEKTDENLEKAGYYGERIVLKLQELGLNTCWTGIFKRSKVKAEVKDGESILITCAVGYGRNQGKPHKSKAMAELTDIRPDEMPDWFKIGVDCAMKAPTAVNHQRFLITLEDGEPVVKKTENGSFDNVDLGIVKFHFEAGSGHKCK